MLAIHPKKVKDCNRSSSVIHASMGSVAKAFTKAPFLVHIYTSQTVEAPWEPTYWSEHFILYWNDRLRKAKRRPGAAPFLSGIRIIARSWYPGRFLRLSR